MSVLGFARKPIGFMSKQQPFCHFGLKMSYDQLLFLALPLIGTFVCIRMAQRMFGHLPVMKLSSDFFYSCIRNWVVMKRQY